MRHFSMQTATVSHLPDISYKLCLLTNRRAGSPMLALVKSRPLQAYSSRKIEQAVSRLLTLE
jgi:hypothetical protein